MAPATTEIRVTITPGVDAKEIARQVRLELDKAARRRAWGARGFDWDFV